MRLATLVLILCLLAGTCQARTTYYTRQASGNDSHTCVQAQQPTTPMRTIAAGLRCLAGGDTLLIGAGTYPEQQLDIPAGTSESTRTIVQAEVAGAVTVAPPGGEIPGGGEQYNFGFHQWTTLRGIIIDCAYKVTLGIGTGPDAYKIRIQDVEITNANGQAIFLRESPGYHELLGIRAHGSGYGPEGCNGSPDNAGPGFCHGIYMSATHVTIDGGRYYHNAGYGMQIYVGNADNAVVRNVRVYDNYSTGIGIFRPHATVTNTLVYNNGTGGDGIGLWLKSEGTLARHNTVWANPGGGILAGDASGSTIQDNIANWIDLGSNTGLKNFEGDPGFVNPAAFDFHLKPDSVARGAASDGTDQGVNFVALDGGTDTVAPSVQITAPTHQALVSGTVSVVATATDNSGTVAGIQLYLDNAPVGAEHPGGHVSVLADSTQTSNGLHTLKARARDQAGNAADSGVIQIVVYNGAPRPQPPGHVPLVCNGSIASVPGPISVVCTPQEGRR
jgi:hypothetical protein